MSEVDSFPEQQRFGLKYKDFLNIIENKGKVYCELKSGDLIIGVLNLLIIEYDDITMENKLIFKIDSSRINSKNIKVFSSEIK